MIGAALVACAGLLALVLAVVFFSPIVVRSDFRLQPALRQGAIVLYLIHPRMARLTYDIAGRRAEVNLFLWGRPLRRSAPDAAPPSTPAAGETDKGSAAAPRARRGEPLNEKERPDSRRGSSRKTDGATAKPDRMNAESADGPAGKGPRFRERIGSAWRTLKMVWNTVHGRRMISKLFRWCGGVLRHVVLMARFDRVRLFATVGIEDPADLGTMFGWLTAARESLLERDRAADLRFEPRFFSDEFACEGSIAVKTSLGRMLVPIAVAAATFPYVGAFMTWRRLKRILPPAEQGHDFVS